MSKRKNELTISSKDILQILDMENEKVENLNWKFAPKMVMSLLASHLSKSPFELTTEMSLKNVEI